MMVSEDDFLTILREELVPALGCTEPISLAFGAAAARLHLGELPTQVEIRCSRNIIKNVKGVIVPNTHGLRGIQAAIGIGFIGGDAEKGLEVLQSVGPEQINEAKTFIEKTPIEVQALDSVHKLHYILKASTHNHSILVEVLDEHTNIVRIERDGKQLFLDRSEQAQAAVETDIRNGLSVKNIIDFCEKVDASVLKPIIEPQIVLNTAICNEGLKNQWGASIGKHMKSTQDSDFITRAKAKAAAGSDARMGGCEMPVVINSGSGNQGITVSIPVIEFAKTNNISDETLYRALALSNLVAIRQKVKIGRLSAYCGAVSAAVGSAAAITWMSKGSIHQIEETITNTLATISGMVCDGAKPSCAAKISLAVEAAFLGHTLAMENQGFIPGDGLVGDSVEDTIDSIGVLASEGMERTDEVIVSLMVDKKKGERSFND